MPPRKPKPTTPKLPTPVDSHKHVDKLANITTEELRGFGRWAFLEIVDPWDAKNTIRAFLQGQQDTSLPLLR